MGATVGEDSVKARQKFSKAHSIIAMGGDDSLNKTKKISKKKMKQNSETGSRSGALAPIESLTPTAPPPQCPTATPSRSQRAVKEVNFRGIDENVKKKNNKKKKSLVNTPEKVNFKNTELENIKADEVHEISDGSKRSMKIKNKKRKKSKTSTAIEEVNIPHTNEDGDELPGKKDLESGPMEHKLRKSKKKKRKNVESVSNIDEVNEKDDVPGRRDDNFTEKRREDSEDNVYQMSSGDEDYSRGMKKWITQYHQGRPGLKVLQERIDDFIMDHEAQEEKAKVEREAQAAEGGWTVVVHHKGRKKTTEAETGVAVGSVAQAAVLDKMAKKKKKDVDLDFYRFQRREAQMNEIMMLQSKFEQDKKRIQQMRAARKFRPY